MKSFVSRLLAFAFCLPTVLAVGQNTSPTEVRLNQIQVIGTHNSYHIAPSELALRAIAARGKQLADSLDYTHAPLQRQFTEFGIRQIELDIFADSEGGLYSKPAIRTLEFEKSKYDVDGIMQRPGMKVLHVQDVDYRTNAQTLLIALRHVRDWLKKHPKSYPIMVMLELKQDSIGEEFTNPIQFGSAELDAIDREILTVFELDEIITPDSVRGDKSTLRKAITRNGWPTLDSVRGKVIFSMDNGGGLPQKYLEGHPSLKGRVLFVSVPETDPAAGFFKVNNPVGDFARIRKLVEKGFLVRTRADAGTKESRENNTMRRTKAFESGAHFVSTDYPVADKRFSEYCVQFDNGFVARANPVSGKQLPRIDFDSPVHN